MNAELSCAVPGLSMRARQIGCRGYKTGWRAVQQLAWERYAQLCSHSESDSHGGLGGTGNQYSGLPDPDAELDAHQVLSGSLLRCS